MKVEQFLKLQMTTLHTLGSPFSTTGTRIKLVVSQKSQCPIGDKPLYGTIHPSILKRNIKLETDTNFQLPEKCLSSG